jgi:hypothetical protein
VENAIETLSSLVDPMDQEQKLSLVLLVKRASKILWTDSKATRNSNERLIPGLCQSKGWAPLNAILREGILHGNVEVKESSGMALSQLIQMSDESGLKAHAINMAGPLIRVLGEKHPSPVKIAILTALNKLLEKVFFHLLLYVNAIKLI